MTSARKKHAKVGGLPRPASGAATPAPTGIGVPDRGLAAPALAQPSVSDAAFVQGIGFLHPHGRRAALQALAGGMKHEWLYTVMLIGDDHRWPALLFKTDAGEHLAFRPRGRD